MTDPTPATPAESLAVAETALRRAQLASDVDALDRLVHESLVFTGPDGALFGKDDDLAAHREGWVRITRLAPRDGEVFQLFGDVAVVVVGMDMAGSFRGVPFAGPFRYTRVWKRFADGWRVVAGHVSAIAAA